MNLPAETKKIRVLIADDHPVVLEGLALILKSAKDIVVVGFAKNGQELLAKAGRLSPDIIIMDVLMPNSNALAIVEEINDTVKPEPGIICCSSLNNNDQILELVNAGINGYIMKTTIPAELQRAIETVANGKNYFCEEVTNIIVDSIRHRSTKSDTEQLFSEKEMRIIKMICEEKSSKEMSEHLGLNIRTLESIKVRIMKKMEVNNVASLVYHALRHHYVDVNDLSFPAHP